MNLVRMEIEARAPVSRPHRRPVKTAKRIESNLSNECIKYNTTTVECECSSDYKCAHIKFVESRSLRKRKLSEPDEELPPIEETKKMKV